MDELTTLMGVMCQFIDIVGSYQLPPEARKKAEKRRQEVKLKLKSELTQEFDRIATNSTGNMRAMQTPETHPHLLPPARPIYGCVKSPVL